MRFKDEVVVVMLDYLCPRTQTRWERTGETGIKIEEK
jgi:hypothetical protein